MNSKQFKSSLCLLLAAAIWGFAFVAQRVAVRSIGPFSLNGIRFAIGALSLLPVLAVFRDPRRTKADNRSETMASLKAGIVCGLILFAAASLQQVGLIGTAAGKSAFITGLYIVMVPIFGLLLGRRIGSNVWLGAVCALAGLFFLCVTEAFTIAGSDLLILGCAFFYTLHILVIDSCIARVNGLKLALFQFVTSSVLSFAVALPTETLTLAGIGDAIVPLLYVGIASTGVAYTLQIIGQKEADPASAAIILSAETLFAMLGGFLLLHERLGLRGLAGAALMLGGIVLTQLPARKKSGN